MKTILFTVGTTIALSTTFNPGIKKNIQDETYLASNSIQAEENLAETKIQVALLLDTSSSMDGLIDQAKSRLWNIVNTLTTLRYDGKMPVIEISLYEYGNDGLSAESGFIRQVTALTTDLDLLSEKLFALRTNGGAEFCGQVIKTSLDELKWDSNKKSMKLIYIAGNEPFNQEGSINYTEAISEAVSKNVFVNTIHCGDDQSGQMGFWKDGAVKGKGEYFFIDQNQKVRYISTPYDVKIDDCNTRLNATYMYYGREGNMMKERQEQQDKAAESISYENKASRAEAKAGSNYSNAGWDLVDAFNQKQIKLEDLDKSTLPEKYKNMTTKQLQTEIEKLNKQRSEIQKEIIDLSSQREKFIQTELEKTGEGETDLGKAITDAVLKFANQQGYTQK
ncbi:vWA domain-containing protein [Moheibacter sediminis]|uniref:von Willebrand factor type A domain-containing protein n=1 Tax=Moheibacter sediminis TaxID=1434700 RepID=A0A1W1Z1T0_9FLAO|nr:vWA domain-containing protein [Moheibacter sediminis]SMC42272.1 von Willebrand factor type A domain-containing protein [Moheibacter sediminis]